MRIEEQRVHAPGERLVTAVKVVVVRDGRKLAAMLCLDMGLMFSMLALYPTDPEESKESLEASQ